MSDLDPATRAIHADRELAELPDVAPAIRPSTNFDERGPRRYRRDSQETVERLEAVLGSLEGGHAVVYPSGMAAIAAALRLLRPGKIALPEDVYHGTRTFVDAEAVAGSWSVAGVDELGPGDVRWIETPSNPKCLITDLTAAAEHADAAGAITVVDSTFATPVLQRPLAHGCSFVVHSTTKFIGGHSDAMGGVVVTADVETASILRRARSRDGSVPGSLDVFLTLRGVRTLPLRVRRQSETATEVAGFLASTGLGVWYPGLAGHPGHDVAVRQMQGFGGVLSFDLGEHDRAAGFVERLELFRIATSLGGVESLAEHRIRSDPASPPGLVRLSIGLEDPADLIADLGRALR